MVRGIDDNQAFLCCAESKALKWIGRKRCFLKIPFQPSSIFVLAQKNKDNNKASFWHPPLPSLHPCPPQKRPKSRQEMPNNAPKVGTWTPEIYLHGSVAAMLTIVWQIYKAKVTRAGTYWSKLKCFNVCAIRKLWKIGKFRCLKWIRSWYHIEPGVSKESGKSGALRWTSWVKWIIH